jgi:hypothetical protein
MTNENSEFIIKTICKTLVDSAEHQFVFAKFVFFRACLAILS